MISQSIRVASGRSHSKYYSFNLTWWKQQPTATSQLIKLREKPSDSLIHPTGGMGGIFFRSGSLVGLSRSMSACLWQLPWPSFFWRRGESEWVISYLLEVSQKIWPSQKERLVFQPSFFSGYLKLRGCIIQWVNIIYHYRSWRFILPPRRNWMDESPSWIIWKLMLNWRLQCREERGFVCLIGVSQQINQVSFPDNRNWSVMFFRLCILISQYNRSHLKMYIIYSCEATTIDSKH